MVQADTQLITAMSTIATVTVTSYKNKCLCGQIYSEYYRKAIPIRDSLELLFAMEQLLDSLSFPKNFMEIRTFGCRTGRKSQIHQGGDRMEIDERAEQPDAKATFVIHVQFRRNATWQGEIRWVDEGKTQTFRSTLEMIRLIDDALESTNRAYQICWEQE